MSKSKVVTLLALAGAALLLTSTAVAQTGAQVTAGDGESTDNSTSQSVTTEGGNVTSANVTVQSVTQKWAAFYGNLDGNDVLADAGGSNFYKWTLSNPTGSVVYAVTDGDAPTTKNPVSDPNTALGGGFDSGVDSASRTFNQSGNVASLGSTQVAETFTSNSPDPAFTTALYEDSGGNPVYAAQVQNGVAGFDGGSYDYQLLVGVGESTADKSFDFYATLN
jgi:hypothetical protein